MFRRSLTLPLMFIPLAAACSDPAAEQGTTAAEERQLDEAAAALDEAQSEYETAIQTPDPEPAAE